MEASGWPRSWRTGGTRELPVWLPAGTHGADSPVAFVAGVIDLLYRDPATGQWVVADYKSDRLGPEEGLAERAAAYASQGAAYVRAMREALDLEVEPRFELWFLRAGRAVTPRSEATGA